MTIPSWLDGRDIFVVWLISALFLTAGFITKYLLETPNVESHRVIQLNRSKPTTPVLNINLSPVNEI
jgi:hypothetical protein